MLTRPLARGEVMRGDRRHRSSAGRRREFAGRHRHRPPSRRSASPRKRALRAGQTCCASRSDEGRARARNETVTIIYEVPGITLTMRGKALEAGAAGRHHQRAQHAVEAHVQGDRHRPRPVSSSTAAATPPRRRRARRPDHRPSNPAQRAPAPSERHDSESKCIRRIDDRRLALPRAPCCTSRRCSADCSALDRLRNDRRAADARRRSRTRPRSAGYKPVQMPMPTPQPALYNPNSLWRNGSRAFFKDQRAHQVGDILTVKVKITDKAKFENETQRSRKNKEDSGVDDFFGKQGAQPIVEQVACRAASSPPTPTRRAKARARSTARKSCSPTSPRVVTQVLPNGNLVIEGKQEVRVNFEVRELIVAGIVRPEDIESDNTIDSTKIARGAHRLWRPRPDHRRAAAALRPAGARRAAAVLVRRRFAFPSA